MTQAPEQSPQAPWLRGLDGLRGAACMMIINTHVMLHLVAEGYHPPAICSLLYAIGVEGLTMFLAMSGLLLYRPYAKAALTRGPMPNIRGYYTSRLLRIYPVNIVIFAFCGLVAGTTVVKLLPRTTQGIEIGRMTDPFAFLANMLLVQGYFPSTVRTGLDVSWSLVVEVAFYVVLPALGWLAYRLADRFSRLLAAIVPALLLIVIGSIVRQIANAQLAHADGDFGPTWTMVLQSSFLANCDAIGWGMAVAAFIAAVDLRRDDDRLVRIGNRLASIGVLGGLIFVVVIHRNLLITPFAAIAWAGVLAKMTMPKAEGIWRLVVKIGELRWLRYLGEISYSVYLWHFMVITWFVVHFEDFRYDSLISLGILWVITASISVALGSITFHFVEAPAMRYAKDLARRRNAAIRVQATEAPAPGPALAG